MTRWLTMIPLLLLLASCGGDAGGPVAIDAMHDACGQCRMIVSDVRLAAQIVAPGEEPRVFDDIGCLRDYLAVHQPAPDATVFVADHRTGEWVDARTAIYTRTRSVYTPMGSRIVAHASPRSRDADLVVAGGDPIPASALFEPVRAAGGAHEWESRMEPLLPAGGTE
jgi:copper chaperone NosL